MKMNFRGKRALWILVFFGVAFSFFGCAHVQTNIMPNENFLDYKAAYIEIQPKDEFNIASAITYQLTDMGMEVLAKKVPDNPPKDSLLVKYTYEDGWDFTIYLKSFQIMFTNAASGKVIANISYHLTGIWVGSQTRIIDAFNDFRRKLGIKELPGGSQDQAIEKASVPAQR